MKMLNINFNSTLQMKSTKNNYTTIQRCLIKIKRVLWFLAMLKHYLTYNLKFYFNRKYNSHQTFYKFLKV